MMPNLILTFKNGLGGLIGETGAHWDKKYILLHVSVMNWQFGLPSLPVSTQLGYPFFNKKSSHIQHNKNQHVKIHTLNDFNLQSNRQQAVT